MFASIHTGICSSAQPSLTWIPHQMDIVITFYYPNPIVWMLVLHRNDIYPSVACTPNSRNPKRRSTRGWMKRLEIVGYSDLVKPFGSQFSLKQLVFIWAVHCLYKCTTCIHLLLVHPFKVFNLALRESTLCHCKGTSCVQILQLQTHGLFSYRRVLRRAGHGIRCWLKLDFMDGASWRCS